MLGQQRVNVLSSKIGSLKLRPPLSVPVGSTVGQFIQTAQVHLAGAVVVCEGRRPVGIITEQDVLMRIVARDVPYTEPVDKFMTKEPCTLRPSDTVGDAIGLMNDESIQHVPIVDALGNVTSLLRVQDIIHHLAESFPEHVVNLPPRPHQKILTPEGA